MQTFNGALKTKEVQCDTVTLEDKGVSLKLLTLHVTDERIVNAMNILYMYSNTKKYDFGIL